MKRYHDRNLVLSYNPRLAFICLPRSVGKSYTYKNYCIERYLKYKEEFVIIRRYVKELKECKSSYFNDIYDNFPNNSIEIKGNKIVIDKQTAGHFIPLTMAGYFKSSAFPKVYNILFDEMIPEGNYNRFLPDECNAFANLLMTIVRRREFRCFLMCNSISTITPYNIYFNLPPFDKNYFDKKRGILIWAEEELDTSSSAQIVQLKSSIATVLEGTIYDDYAIKGKTLKKGETDRIRKRDKANSKLIFIIANENIEYIGVYYDLKTYDIIVDCDCDTSFPIKFNFDLFNLRECEKMFDKSTNYAKIIRDAKKGGFLYYSDIQTKYIASDILKRI